MNNNDDFYDDPNYDDNYYNSSEDDYYDADVYWTCDICDGDESTGCLFNNPSECPR